jgi:hypothetical protein
MKLPCVLGGLAFALMVSAAQAAGSRPGVAPPAQGRHPVAAAAPSSPYQPSYSIHLQPWWQPHPYFQPRSEGFGYPTRPARGAHPQPVPGYSGRAINLPR